MSKITKLEVDPRPAPAQKERRTYELRILTGKGEPYTACAYREDRIQDANGVDIGPPIREDRVVRILTPEFFAANPNVAAAVKEISAIIDAWDDEDIAAKNAPPAADPAV